MSKIRMLGISTLLLLLGSLVAVSCGGGEGVSTERIVEVQVEKIVEVEVEKIVEVEVLVEVPGARKVLGEEVGEPVWTFHVVSGAYPHPFWEVYKQGALDAGNDFNVNVVFDMLPEHDVVEHAARVDQVRALNPDGLVIAVNDISIDGPARRAIDAGIPVIAVNSRDRRPDDERIPYLFYIGQDEVLAGYTLARRALAEMAKYDGRVPKRAGLGIALPGHPVFEDRKAGFVDLLGEMGIPFDIIDLTFDPTTMKERMRAHFQNHPDTDLWLTVHVDPFVPVALEFWEEIGRSVGGADGIHFWTFDINEDGIQEVRNGNLLGMVDQQIYLEGYLPIQWLFLYKKWGFVPANDILTGPTIVDKSNVDIVEASVIAGYRR